MRPRQASIHALLCTAALAISTPALSDTITVKSAGGSDTAEENIGTGAVGTSSSDLEMMTEGSEPQLVEFIFRDTDLPDDATICDAFITFTASEVNIGFDPADLTISGELTDDASDIKGGDDNLSNRAQTLASVNWQPAEWTVVDQTHQTPSLATVIQEIVDSLGPGDDTDELGIFVQGQGTRHTYSEDDSPSDAAELTVEYFTPGSSCASPTVYQDRVDGGNRDGEEDLRDGDMSRSDDTIELGIEDDTKQYVGIRFDSIEIPQGSTINSAVIDFTVDEVNDAPTPTYLRFQGHDVDDSATFGGNSDISDRLGSAATSAAVEFLEPSWVSVGATETTPDLSSIVQEIVNRGGWAAGNAMSFLVSGTGERTAEANGTLAPVLRVDFTPPAGVDIRLMMSDSPDPVNVGSPLQYTIDLDNVNVLDATGVVLTDSLPAEVTYLSHTASQGTCTYDVSGGTLNCMLGTIAGGASAQVIIIVDPVSIGATTNSASATLNEVDVNASNNADAETTQILSSGSQICYPVADSTPDGDQLDYVDLGGPALFTVGTTGTQNIEAASYNSQNGIYYAADQARFGAIDLTTGAFSAIGPDGMGAATTPMQGALGSQSISDVDGLAYDATTNTMYGTERQGSSMDDFLFVIDMTTGTYVQNAFGSGIDYVAVPRITASPAAGDLDDIAVDPNSGQMYGVYNDGASSADYLVTINKLTGARTSQTIITRGGSNVLDFEGLGIDSSGQLFGVTGSNEALYTIDSTTAVATLQTSLPGRDYEAVDCFQFSTSAEADLGLSKTVSDATPREGTTIAYGVSVTNNGPNIATIVQISDVLPAGVTYQSHTVSQGTYDPASGNWFVGDIVTGATPTLDIEVVVDPGTFATTITNTASVVFQSQNDPTAGNDSASVDIVPDGQPDLLLMKTQYTFDDPVLGDPDGDPDTPTPNAKSIPGATKVYTMTVINSGPGSVDADSIVLTDAIPDRLVLRVADFDSGTTGPIAYDPGTSGLAATLNFVSLSDLNDDVQFSTDGSNFDYVPTPDPLGLDASVTHLRINPKGAMAGASGSNVSFSVSFKVRLE